MALFTRGSKSRKNLTILLKIVVFICLFCLMVAGLDALVADRVSEAKIQIIYDGEGYDTVILGSSRVYHGIAPLAMDEVTGYKTANVASANQSITASYYLLVEALKSNPVQRVLLLVDSNRLLNTRWDSDLQYLAIEHMHLSLNKLEFMYNGFALEHFPATLLRCYRARGNLTWENIVANLTHPAKEPDLNSPMYPYIGRNYMVNSQRIDPVETPQYKIEPFAAHLVPAMNLDYFEKIAVLCSQKAIDLVLFSVPMLPSVAINSKDYAVLHTYIQDLANSYNLPYWDFNYIKPDIIKLEDPMFADAYHPNDTLSLPLSKLMGTMLFANESGTLDNGDYLFDSFADYLQSQNRITAVYIKGYQKGDRTITAKAIVGANVEAEYRYSLSDNKNGIYHVLKDWSDTATAEVPTLSPGEYWLKVEARQKGSAGDAEKLTRRKISIQE